MDLPLSKLVDIVKDPDLKIKISDLVTENLKLKEENFQLRKELGGRKQTEQIALTLIHDNNHYYLKDDSERLEPFCTNCWDTKQSLIRLHKGNQNYGVQHYICPNCKTGTSIGDYRPTKLDQSDCC